MEMPTEFPACPLVELAFAAFALVFALLFALLFTLVFALVFALESAWAGTGWRSTPGIFILIINVSVSCPPIHPPSQSVSPYYC